MKANDLIRGLIILICLVCVLVIPSCGQSTKPPLDKLPIECNNNLEQIRLGKEMSVHTISRLIEWDSKKYKMMEDCEIYLFEESPEIEIIEKLLDCRYSKGIFYENQNDREKQIQDR